MSLMMELVGTQLKQYSTGVMMLVGNLVYALNLVFCGISVKYNFVGGLWISQLLFGGPGAVLVLLVATVRVVL